MACGRFPRNNNDLVRPEGGNVGSQWLTGFLGFGFGSFWNDAHRAELHRRHPMVIPARYAHSLYLELLLNGGILWLGLFLATLGGVSYDAALMATPAGSLILALVVFTIVHGVAESMFALPSYRMFALMLFLVAMQ